MAIRVGQLTVQYVADTADASDLRVTRVFAQSASPSSAPIVKNVAQTIFADPTDNKVEQAGPNFYRSIALTFFVPPTNGVDAENDPVYNRSVGHQLFGAAGDTTAEALYRAVAHTILTVGANPDEERWITQYLGFTDRQFQDVGHALFRQVAPVKVSEASIQTAFNTFFAGSQSLVIDRTYQANVSLGWTVAIVQQYELDIEHDLNLGETLDTSSNTWSRDENPATSSSGGGLLRQSISIEVDNNDCRSEEFDPIIGTGPNDEYEEFSIDGPALVDASGVTLEYPAEGVVTDTLTLENPDFGNDHTNSFTRVDRATRGGDRKIFSDQKWAKWERLTMTISGIGCGGTPTVQNVIDFLNTTLGKEIRLTDWESRQWKGFIVAPETDIIEEQEGIRLQLVFEGEITTLEVQYDQFDVIHGQDSNGDDIEVTYEF